MTDASAPAPGTDSLSVAALSFQTDLAEVTTCEDATRWNIQRVDGAHAVWVTMSPVTHSAERFHALIRWETYQDCAPSVKFGDPATGRLDVTSAWPSGGPFRPTSFAMCVSYTAEGFGMHPEWVRDPLRRWDARGNGLLKVIRWLQEDLDVHFAGRHP